jgi:hypothetical protein
MKTGCTFPDSVNEVAPTRVDETTFDQLNKSPGISIFVTMIWKTFDNFRSQ